MTGPAPASESYEPVKKTYARQAAIYDRLWGKYNEATLGATLEAAPQATFRHILDVACGPGLFIEVALRRWPDATVVGLDVTPEMLEQARQRVGRQARVRLVRSLAERIPFPDFSFDLVVCANSFHHFRAPEKALSEFCRLLRTDGSLVLTDWCDDYLACKVCDWWLRLTDPSHFKAYGLEDCLALLRAAGFRIRHARKFKISWLWGVMTVEALAPPTPSRGARSGPASVGAASEAMN